MASVSLFAPWRVRYELFPDALDGQMDDYSVVIAYHYFVSFPVLKRVVLR
jgi:hypothetical protein